MKLVKLDDVLVLIDGSMADLESNYENSKLQEEIKRLPTVDAVEVVRCEDCQYYYEQPRGFSPICELTRSRTEKEGFCAWGKKKDE